MHYPCLVYHPDFTFALPKKTRLPRFTFMLPMQ